MIQELWGNFPRLIEQNINGLLDEAGPNRIKAFQLYRTCKYESVWSDSYEKFAKSLDEFYSRSRVQRRKGQFDAFLDRPMGHDVYEQFHLNFRTAEVSESSVRNLASWAHNLIRVSKKTAEAVIALDVMLQTLRYITQPGPHDKAENIEFEDFCSAWKKTVFKFFGQRHDEELNHIVTELRWIDAQLKSEQAEAPAVTALALTPFLSASESEWVIGVREAALSYSKIPRFLKSKVSEKKQIQELERVISLFEIVRVTHLPELIKHRENIRVTLVDRCDRLLAMHSGTHSDDLATKIAS